MIRNTKLRISKLQMHLTKRKLTAPIHQESKIKFTRPLLMRFECTKIQGQLVRRRTSLSLNTSTAQKQVQARNAKFLYH